jgi:DNA polymerase-3 subunit gamma/tau
MLSASAFNALLKTLEEPPAHAKFIFATTEPEKILPTVVSRCQRFDLRRIPVPLIAERLRVIANDEGVKVSDDALLAIARGADGGMRDAQSALDQLIAFTGTEIGEADVLSVFGLVARKSLEDLGAAILRGDVVRILTLIDELDRGGKDLRRLTVELIDHFRNLLVYMHVGDAATGLDLTDTQRATLQAQSKDAKAPNVLQIVEILIDLDGRLRLALSRRTLLETALVRAARAAAVTPLEDILKRLTALRGSPPGPTGATVAAPRPTEVPPPTPAATPSAASRTTVSPAGAAGVPESETPTPSSPPSSANIAPPPPNHVVAARPAVRLALEILGGRIVEIH